MVSDQFPINDDQTWSQKTLAGKKIWEQVKSILLDKDIELPTTPRRPDLRMILKNVTGDTIQFLNPGMHSDRKPQIIPGSDQGKGVATMLELAGATMEDQQANARILDEKYNLAEKGLTTEFTKALGDEVAAGRIVEAYGPAPFDKQAARLVDLHWEGSNIIPHQEGNVAYGARNPEEEAVFRSELAIFVHCEGKTPEKMEMDGMCIAIDVDWRTKEESTRPIVPSKAKQYYGQHYYSMPVVELDTEGNVASIDLKNGTPVIHLDDPNGANDEDHDRDGQDAHIGMPS